MGALSKRKSKIHPGETERSRMYDIVYVLGLLGADDKVPTPVGNKVRRLLGELYTDGRVTFDGEKGSRTYRRTSAAPTVGGAMT